MTDDTRSRILASALVLIGEHGYSGMSIRHIADSLGITKAAVHYHFAAKEQIAHALMEPGFAALDATLARGDGPEALLRGFADLLATYGPTMHLLASDPSMREVAGVESRAKEQMGRFVEALGPDRLRAMTALGAVQFGMMAALGNPKFSVLAAASDGAELTHRLDVVVAAGLAALRS